MKFTQPGHCCPLFPPLPYLHHIDAGVQVDGSLGFLAVLFILVGVEDVRAVRELRQIEEPPFEDLESKEIQHV